MSYEVEKPRSMPRMNHQTAPPSPVWAYPESWYWFCSEKSLRRGPIARELLGRQLVAFLTSSGHVGVLENRCVHMGARLSAGCVVDETIQCPLHHWRFDTRGECTHIPAADRIPIFAKQQRFPAAVRGGQVYLFNGAEPKFPLPEFGDIPFEQLVAAPPYIETVACPWYMVGANAVDVQHYLIAHDRRMIDRPVIDYPHQYAHRAVCHFQVEGNSLADWVTRELGGPEVKLEVTDWASTMIFAHSSLDQAETFGMLCLVPLSMQRTQVHITIMARRSSQRWKRAIVDPLRARARRMLVRKFLRSDVERLADTRYSPATLIDVDNQFSEYFVWLGGLAAANVSDASDRVSVLDKEVAR